MRPQSEVSAVVDLNPPSSLRLRRKWMQKTYLPGSEAYIRSKNGLKADLWPRLIKDVWKSFERPREAHTAGATVRICGSSPAKTRSLP